MTGSKLKTIFLFLFTCYWFLFGKCHAIVCNAISSLKVKICPDSVRSIIKLENQDCLGTQGEGRIREGEGSQYATTRYIRLKSTRLTRNE